MFNLVYIIFRILKFKTKVIIYVLFQQDLSFFFNKQKDCSFE